MDNFLCKKCSKRFSYQKIIRFLFEKTLTNIVVIYSSFFGVWYKRLECSSMKNKRLVFIIHSCNKTNIVVDDTNMDLFAENDCLIFCTKMIRIFLGKRSISASSTTQLLRGVCYNLLNCRSCIKPKT